MNDDRDVRDLPANRGDSKWFAVFGTAALGIFLALETRGRCIDTGGSFPLNDSAALPSNFCRSTHLFPGSFGSDLLFCMVYLAPAALVLAGSVGAKRLEQRAIYWAALVVAVMLLLVEALLLSKAHLGYRGV
jgi:hypothetical protein